MKLNNKLSLMVLVAISVGIIVVVLLASYFTLNYRFFIKVKQDTNTVEIKDYKIETISEVNAIPEWHPAIGILVSYPFQLPYALLKEIATENKLYIVTKDEKSKQKCLNELHLNAVNTVNATFIYSQQSDGYYGTRDWGPYTIRSKDGYSLVAANYHDYPFSGYDSQSKKLSWLSDVLPLQSLKHDNKASMDVAHFFNSKIQKLTIALTGGSAMFDGQGTLFINQIVIDENRSLGISFEKFMDQLKSSFGIKRLIVIPNHESWGVQHIDCLLKLLDESRILIKKLDTSHPDYQRVESIADEFSRLRNSNGDFYTVLRIYTPNYATDRAAPYINALIFNKKIFVPTVGIAGDAMAINTWKSAMPDYTVFGYQMDKNMNPWTYTDALHCRTKSIFFIEEHGVLKTLKF
jgi:agmatine deiminase